MIKVCLSGIGRTGKEIAKALFEQADIKIVSAICSPGSEKERKNLDDVVEGVKTNVIIRSSDDLLEVIQSTKPDIVVDFSTPDAVLRNANIYAKMGVNMLIGTTGFTNIGLKRLMLMAHKNRVGLLYAPNITTGINVMMMLTNLAASILNEYDFQITEVHHKHKKDVPSGTAMKIALEIEKGLKSVGVGMEASEILINSVRAGGIIGKHDVMLVSEFDKIEISHESFSRKAFALGAMKGIKFLEGKVGYFEMRDVLNFKEVLEKYIERENGNHNYKILRYSIDNDDEKEVENF